MKSYRNLFFLCIIVVLWLGVIFQIYRSVFQLEIKDLAPQIYRVEDIQEDRHLRRNIVFSKDEFDISMNGITNTLFSNNRKQENKLESKETIQSIGENNNLSQETDEVKLEDNKNNMNGDSNSIKGDISTSENEIDHNQKTNKENPIYLKQNIQENDIHDTEDKEEEEKKEKEFVQSLSQNNNNGNNDIDNNNNNNISDNNNNNISDNNNNNNNNNISDNNISDNNNNNNNNPSYQLIGNRRTAVVIMTYNRPQYLQKTMNTLFTVLRDKRNRYSIDMFISQDGNEPSMLSIINQIQIQIQNIPAIHLYQHWNHEQTYSPGDSPYHKLARHFGWAFNRLIHEFHYEQVIVIEDDLLIACDFFEYFAGVSPLLWEDNTILAASAWNDNGFSEFVGNPATLVRSDFFPGLGWMFTSTIWREMGPKWPAAYWDDWLRRPDIRKNRVIIRPEICRTYTFGEVGSSNSQFYSQYLKPIVLNTQFVQFTSIDMNQYKKVNYDKWFIDSIQNAKTIQLIPSFQQQLKTNSVYKIFYPSTRDGYRSIAHSLGLMPDSKAGVPRGAYMGVIPLRIHSSIVYLVPQNGPSFNYIE
ncbi:hypothetical protein WA158_005234 [Blastocystis sp. Blastoise]